MGNKEAFLGLSLLFIASFANAHLFPENYEVVYNYKGLVSASVDKEGYYSSSYYVSAKLTLNSFHNYTTVSISEMKYHLYSGKGIFFDQDDSAIGVSDGEMKKFTPFIIQYEESGKSIGILTQETDELWHVNFKRAIASLLQLDTVPMTNKTGSFEYYTDETTAFGRCSVFYTVAAKKSEEGLTVRKSIVPGLCSEPRLRVFHSMKSSHCDSTSDAPITTGSDRTYEVNKIAGKYIIESIESNNRINLNMFNGASEMHSVDIKQTLTKESAKEITGGPKIDMENMKYKKLKQVVVDQEARQDNLHDFIGFEYDSKKLFKNIRLGLKHAVGNLDHFSETDFNVTHENTLYFVVEQMRLLNKYELKKYMKYFRDVTDDGPSKPSYKLYLQILPTLGTKASVYVIKDIIEQKLININESKTLISEIPFYLRYPDKVLVKDLITLKNNVSDEIKTEVILALATITSGALELYPNDSELYEIVDGFIEDFKTSKTYEEHVLYISALHNVGSPKATKFLNRLARNDGVVEGITPHFRSLALLASKTADSTHRLSWALLQNPEEDFEVRSTALYVLMGKPTFDTLFKINLYLENNEEEGTLYTMFRKTLKFLAAVNTPCMKSAAESAKRVLRIVDGEKVFEANSVFMGLEYFDKDYRFGDFQRFSIVGDLLKNNFTSMYYLHSPQRETLNLNVESEYAHITIGNYKAAMDSLKSKDSVTPLSIFTILGSRALLNIEYLMMRNGKVFAIDYISHGKFYDLNDYLAYRLSFDRDIINDYKFGVSLDGHIAFPTDIGVPAIFYFQISRIEKLNIRVDNMQDSTMYDSHVISHEVRGLRVYDALSDLWMGTKRNIIVKSRVPFNFTITNYGLLFNNTFEDGLGEFAFESSAFAQIYIEELVNSTSILRETCETCNATSLVYDREEYVKEYNIFEHDCSYLNTEFKLTAKNCELNILPKDTMNFISSIVSSEGKNLAQGHIYKVPLMLQQLKDYLYTHPNQKMCMFKFTVKPKQTHSRLMIVPQDKWKATFWYDIFDNEKEIVSHEFAFELQPDVSNIKYHRKINDEYVQVTCLKVESEWKNYTYERHHKFLSGPNKYSECPENETVVDVSMRADPTPVSDFIEYYESCGSSSSNNLKCITNEGYFDTVWVNYTYRKVPEWILSGLGDTIIRLFPMDFSPLRGGVQGEDGYVRATIDLTEDLTDFDVTVESSRGNGTYKSIKAENTIMEYLVPHVNVLTPNIATSIMNAYGEFDFCEISISKRINVFGKSSSDEINEEWVQIVAGKKDKDSDWNVSVKKMTVGEDEKLALQIVSFNETMGVKPGDNFEVTFNGGEPQIIESGFRIESWFVYKAIPRWLIINIKPLDTFIAYDGNVVRIHLRKTKKNKGICYTPEEEWY